MEDCLICYESKPLITVHHTCRFCAECVFDWLRSQATINKHIDLDSLASCPTQGCSHKKTFNEFSINLLNSYKIELNEIYFRNYTSRASDILHCPNVSCEYAGYTVPSHFGCQVPFECKSCGYEWAHPLVRGSSDSKWQRFKTFIVKEFTSKRCPHCQTYITFSGGCRNIRCAACGRSFSWLEAANRGWLTVIGLIGIPLFVLICYYYRSMVDSAKKSWKVNVGVWVLHFVLVHIWAFMLLYYITVYGDFMDRHVNRRKLLLTIGVLIPIGSLVGLNFLMPEYYGYWIVIATIEFCFAMIYAAIVFYPMLHGLTNRPWRERRRRRLRELEDRINNEEQIIRQDPFEESKE